MKIGPNSPDYIRYRAKCYLDGVLLDNCLFADDERGYVVLARRGTDGKSFLPVVLVAEWWRLCEITWFLEDEETLFSDRLEGRILYCQEVICDVKRGEVSIDIPGGRE